MHGFARFSLASLALLPVSLLAAACDGHRHEQGPLYAQASAQLTQIRPRQTVDPNEDIANDPNSVTSWWPVEGTATFKTTSEGVDVFVFLRNCRGPYLYPVRLFADARCDQLTQNSVAWDGARGRLAQNAFCLGSAGARLYYSRSSEDAKPWSIGGARSSDLVGRTLAVLDPDTGEPLACGKIELPDGGMPTDPPDPAELPAPPVAAEIAGACLLRLGPPRADAGAPCPDPQKLGECALVHCVSPCLGACAEHVACVEAHPDCSGTCIPNDACNKCLDGAQCTLGHCRKQISCAPLPTPGGPCTEFRACCMRQGPLVAACLEYATQLEQIAGDSSCLGALEDWDVNTNFTYRSPCYRDGGVPTGE
jgi:hypothetical protein